MLTPLRQLVLDGYEWDYDEHVVRRFGTSCASPAVLTALLDSAPSLLVSIHMPLTPRAWMRNAWGGSMADNQARYQRFGDLQDLVRQYRDRVQRLPLDRSWH
jgi:hypothetical protein